MSADEDDVACTMISTELLYYIRSRGIRIEKPNRVIGLGACNVVAFSVDDYVPILLSVSASTAQDQMICRSYPTALPRYSVSTGSHIDRSTLRDDGARLAKGPIHNIRVSKTRLPFLDSPLAILFNKQLDSDGVTDGS
jgi:hypothetical protein